MTTIHKISLDGSAVKVHVIDPSRPTAAGHRMYTTTLAELPLFLIEMFAFYTDVEELSSRMVITDAAVGASVVGLTTAIPGVSIEANESVVIASAFSGDAKGEVAGAGSSVVHAIGTLLRQNGFKTKAFDGETYNGDLSVTQWMEDFRYGFARRSDEKLQEELAGLLQPDIGAW